MNGHRASGEVVAYSAMETCELEDYAKGIAERHPDVRMRFVRESTSALADRLTAEADGGGWDVIFGVALTGLPISRLEDNLAVLSWPEFDDLSPGAVDRDGRWFGPSAFVPAFCVNRQRSARLGLPRPTSWVDLTAPGYRGELVIPDPNRSGAGYLHLAALRQACGSERAWQVLSGVALNEPRIAGSSVVPCEAATSGATSIGVTVSTAAQRAVLAGAAVDIVVPEDAAGIEPEVFALRRESPAAKAATPALRWMLGPEAAAIYRRYRKIPLRKRYADGESQTAKIFAIDAVRAAADKVEDCRRWSDLFLRDRAVQPRNS